MSITIDLTGRTAWVTGGASGIGAAIVSRCAMAGARVVSLDIAYPREAGDADRMIRQWVNLQDPSAIETVTSDLLRRGYAPDILVNCAGIARDGVVWKLTDEAWDEVLAVNLNAAFRLVRACVPSMKQARDGIIVNIASINGIRGKVGQANYSASKGGLIALGKTLARELGASGIRVNTIAPGMIETPLTASLPERVRAAARAETLLGRIGVPDDVANAVLFLASPLARHITGQTLIVDGGQLLL
ncbi:MAG: SDR family oxidoreductase [Acidobacteria bacterium]|nr:SDR family oxidoreductase [Acidobacteriota bacterium]